MAISLLLESLQVIRKKSATTWLTSHLVKFTKLLVTASTQPITEA